MIISKISYSQDTLASIKYDVFDDDVKLFTHTYTPENTLYIFGVTEFKVRCLAIDVVEKKQKEFWYDIDIKMENIRAIFFTDTSFIILVKNRSNKLNTFRYEYNFITKQQNTEDIQLDILSEGINITAFNRDKKMYGIRYNSQDKKIIAYQIDEAIRTQKVDFNVSDIIKSTGLKTSYLSNFIYEDLPTSFDGDYLIQRLNSQTKCYFLGDKIYIIRNASSKMIDMLVFDLTTKTASYKIIEKEANDCKASSHYSHLTYYTSSLFQNKLISTTSCEHNINIWINDIISGKLEKRFSLNSNNDTSLRQSICIKDYPNDKSRKILDGYKKLLNSIDTKNSYVYCGLIDSVNVQLTYGTFETDRAITGIGILLNMASAFVGVTNSFGTGYFNAFGNKFMTSTTFLTTTCNTQNLTLDKELTIKKLKQSNIVNDFENKYSCEFIANKVGYTFLYYYDNKMIYIVKAK